MQEQWGPKLPKKEIKDSSGLTISLLLPSPSPINEVIVSASRTGQRIPVIIGQAILMDVGFFQFCRIKLGSPSADVAVHKTMAKRVAHMPPTEIWEEFD